MNNSVELLGFYGGDEAHALSAWTSTSRELDENKIKRIPDLIKFLAENGHHSPFEKSSLHFLVNTDIATHIHLLKHRVAVSVNAECLHGDTLITFVNINGTSNKTLRKSIKDLYYKWNHGRSHQATEKDALYNKKRISNMRLRVLNEETGYFGVGHIKDIYYSGVKKIYQIKLKNGEFIKCSANHRILTENGWQTLESGLRLGLSVAINGLKTEVEGKPYTFKDFFDGAENYTRAEFSKLKNIKYVTCKKWGYIFNIVFKENPNKNFKKGKIPWNKNVKGYKLNISPKGLQGRKKAVKRGEDSHFWRGGMSNEREIIGAWTRNIAKQVHEKYNFTCQFCGKGSGNLVAHHIIPVCQNESLACEFNNLITLCDRCHIDVHRSLESELHFANKVLDSEFIPFSYDKRLGNKIGKYKLKVHYSPIVEITELGEDEVYDIEVEGEWKNFVADGIVVHNSARYKELKEDKYYLPSDFPSLWQNSLEEYTNLGLKLYHQCLNSLVNEHGFSRKRAKESARYFRTYNTQICADVMFNFRSFMHFQTLRNSDDAQKEVRDVAQQMLELVKGIPEKPFEHSLAAFGF